MKKNDKVYSRTIERKDDSMQTEAAISKEPKRQMKTHRPSVAARIAESDIFYSNFKFTGAREAFPNAPAMRTVDLYFPYAIGGELLVDSPNTAQEIASCEAKATVLKKLGYRYLIVMPDMDEFAAKEQLGET